MSTERDTHGGKRERERGRERPSKRETHTRGKKERESEGESDRARETRVHAKSLSDFREYGERNSPTKCLPAMMWRPTWIPRRRGRPRK